MSSFNFTIPKKKKRVRDESQSERVSKTAPELGCKLTRPDEQQEKEIRRIIEEGMWDKRVGKYVRIDEMRVINNNRAQWKYDRFREELRSDRRPLGESFTFLQIGHDDKELAVCLKYGFRAGCSNVLGEVAPVKYGVYVNRHVDLTTSVMRLNQSYRIVIFKTSIGRCYIMDPGSFSNVPVNTYNSFMCEDPPREDAHKRAEAYRRDVTLIYELDALEQPRAFPSGILPYALIDIRLVKSGPYDKALSAYHELPTPTCLFRHKLRAMNMLGRNMHLSIHALASNVQYMNDVSTLSMQSLRDWSTDCHLPPEIRAVIDSGILAAHKMPQQAFVDGAGYLTAGWLECESERDGRDWAGLLRWMRKNRKLAIGSWMGLGAEERPIEGYAIGMPDGPLSLMLGLPWKKHKPVMHLLIFSSMKIVSPRENLKNCDVMQTLELTTPEQRGVGVNKVRDGTVQAIYTQHYVRRIQMYRQHMRNGGQHKQYRPPPPSLPGNGNPLVVLLNDDADRSQLGQAYGGPSRRGLPPYARGARGGLPPYARGGRGGMQRGGGPTRDGPPPRFLPSAPPRRVTPPPVIPDEDGDDMILAGFSSDEEGEGAAPTGVGRPRMPPLSERRKSKEQEAEGPRNLMLKPGTRIHHEGSSGVPQPVPPPVVPGALVRPLSPTPSPRPVPPPTTPASSTQPQLPRPHKIFERHSRWDRDDSAPAAAVPPPGIVTAPKINIRLGAKEKEAAAPAAPANRDPRSAASPADPRAAAGVVDPRAAAADPRRKASDPAASTAKPSLVVDASQLKKTDARINFANIFSQLKKVHTEESVPVPRAELPLPPLVKSGEGAGGGGVGGGEKKRKGVLSMPLPGVKQKSSSPKGDDEYDPAKAGSWGDDDDEEMDVEEKEEEEEEADAFAPVEEEMDLDEGTARDRDERFRIADIPIIYPAHGERRVESQRTMEPRVSTPAPAPAPIEKEKEKEKEREKEPEEIGSHSITNLINNIIGVRRKAAEDEEERRKKEKEDAHVKGISSIPSLMQLLGKKKDADKERPIKVEAVKEEEGVAPASPEPETRLEEIPLPGRGPAQIPIGDSPASPDPFAMFGGGGDVDLRRMPAGVPGVPVGMSPMTTLRSVANDAYAPQRQTVTYVAPSVAPTLGGLGAAAAARPRRSRFDAPPSSAAPITLSAPLQFPPGYQGPRVQPVAPGRPMGAGPLQFPPGYPPVSAPVTQPAPDCPASPDPQPAFGSKDVDIRFMYNAQPAPVGGASGGGAGGGGGTMRVVSRSTVDSSSSSSVSSGTPRRNRFDQPPGATLTPPQHKKEIPMPMIVKREVLSPPREVAAPKPAPAPAPAPAPPASAPSSAPINQTADLLKSIFNITAPVIDAMRNNPATSSALRPISPRKEDKDDGPPASPDTPASPDPEPSPAALPRRPMDHDERAIRGEKTRRAEDSWCAAVSKKTSSSTERRSGPVEDGEIETDEEEEGEQTAPAPIATAAQPAKPHGPPQRFSNDAPVSPRFGNGGVPPGAGVFGSPARPPGQFGFPGGSQAIGGSPQAVSFFGGAPARGAAVPPAWQRGGSVPGGFGPPGMGAAGAGGGGGGGMHGFFNAVVPGVRGAAAPAGMARSRIIVPDTMLFDRCTIDPVQLESLCERIGLFRQQHNAVVQIQIHSATARGMMDKMRTHGSSLPGEKARAYQALIDKYAAQDKQVVVVMHAHQCDHMSRSLSQQAECFRTLRNYHKGAEIVYMTQVSEHSELGRVLREHGVQLWSTEAVMREYGVPMR